MGEVSPCLQPPCPRVLLIVIPAISLVILAISLVIPASFLVILA